MKKSLTTMFDLMMILLVSFVLLADSPKANSKPSPASELRFQSNLKDCLQEVPEIGFTNDSTLISKKDNLNGEYFAQLDDLYIIGPNSIDNMDSLVVWIRLDPSVNKGCTDFEVNLTFYHNGKIDAGALTNDNSFFYEFSL